MPRKGSPKVRTGCITCKIRRVKCDEAKPSCKKCTTTGRTCDGYTSQPYATPLSSGLRLHVSESEFRALDFFFHRNIASAITSNLDTELFWTHTVQQASQREPAVRHAVAAISSLYECLGTARTPQRNTFALQQYNRAIAELVTTTPDEATILFVCVLMICVEFLLGDIKAAINHCRHGVIILNRSSVLQSTRDQLLPIFCRLSISPYFFESSPPMFSLLAGLELPGHDFARHSHLNTAQLRCALEVLTYRGARLMRIGVECRRSDTPILPDNLNEQCLLRASLQYWSVAFQRFKDSTSFSASEIMTQTCNLLEVKRLIVTVWIDCALDPNESGYDRHIETFRTMVSLSAMVLESASPTPGQPRPRFTFEMGFLPLLYFVSVKCRCLHTRVAALRLIRSLSASRENLWDADTSFRMGKRIVLLENGVDVDGLDLDVSWDAMAGMLWQIPEERRMLDLVMEPGLEVDADGVGWRVASCLTRGNEGKLRLLRERVPFGF
ncbi:C6 zinc finger protein [Apodospora peruviana]|uniref:C6 zinc finger protein n=1 Tax=Apodospora peruviana TaxID=516989 RepID=A0AAE0HTD1_9PEZI|nr:C6 zinc finger protein [Apodospora peruviana]